MKTISFHLQGNPHGCIAFVDLFGLKTLFPLLTNCGKGKHAGDKEFDETVISCLLSLVKSLTPDEPDRHKRLMNKFTELNFDKINKLVEMYQRYATIVEQADKDNSDINGDNDEDTAEQKLLDRLDAGLYTLQSICLILAYLAAWNEDIRNYLSDLFEANSMSLNEPAKYLAELEGQVGSETEKESIAKIVKESIIFSPQTKASN